jgi:hypothetical protein
MANATPRDVFDRQFREFAGQYNARSTGTWLTTLLTVPWLGAVAYAAWSAERRSPARSQRCSETCCGESILRGHTVASLLNAREKVPAVLAVTTGVPGETGELGTIGDILMRTAVTDLGVELPSTDLVEDPAHAELESHQ